MHYSVHMAKVKWKIYTFQSTPWKNAN